MLEKKAKKRRMTSVEPGRQTSIGVRKITTWQQVKDDFLFWKKAQGLSETTLKGIATIFLISIDVLKTFGQRKKILYIAIENWTKY